MDIPIQADVVCIDGVVGESTHIIVDLVSEQVTHFVVRTSHDHKRFVAPIDKIEDTERTDILIKCNKEDFYQLASLRRVAFPWLRCLRQRTANAFAGDVGP